MEFVFGHEESLLLVVCPALGIKNLSFFTVWGCTPVCPHGHHKPVVDSLRKLPQAHRHRGDMEGNVFLMSQNAVRLQLHCLRMTPTHAWRWGWVVRVRRIKVFQISVKSALRMEKQRNGRSVYPGYCENIIYAFCER